MDVRPKKKKKGSGRDCGRGSCGGGRTEDTRDRGEKKKKRGEEQMEER